MSAGFTMPARSLAEVVGPLAAVPAQVEITDLSADSRSVRAGGLFLALQGHKAHGLEHAPQAVARGARAVLWEPAAGVEARDLGPRVFAAPVAALAQRAGEIADRFFAAPSAALTIAGITGTNGKTTCAWLLSQALIACGRRAAYVGTLGFGRPEALAVSTHTTPDAVTVHRQLAALRADGASFVAMEVSSHALHQSRVAGVRFHTAAFTNLTRDHLDYHGTMEAYAAAKSRLFEWPGLAARVINLDDAFGRELAARPGGGRLILTSSAGPSPGPRVAALDGAATHVHARRVSAGVRGLALEIETEQGSASLGIPLLGRFNADNVLTVLAVLLGWGVPLDEAAAALARTSAPPGRMEAFLVREGGPLAIVDYAHSPDALAAALEAARLHCPGKLWVVFGCGGDRDAGKRPLMGGIAAEGADCIVLTDDNPRSEDPAAIVAQIRGGIPAESTRQVEVVHDRAAAIRGALRAAGPGDVVLVAGKGHESEQIYGSERRVFSDQAIVRSEMT